MVMPHDVDAENSAIGAALYDIQAATVFCKQVTPEDFYIPHNKEIARAIHELNNQNKAIDIITVKSVMKNADIQYLSDLAVSVPTASNIKHYCDLVKSKAIRRQFILASEKVRTMAQEGSYDTIIDFKNEAMAIMDIEVRKEKLGNTAKEIACSYSEKIDERYNSKNKDKLYTGYGWVDKITGGLFATEVTIVAARPSVGKTALSTQLAINLALKKNHCVIFNLEMGKDQLMERIVANMGGIEMSRLRNPKKMTEADWQQYAKALGRVGDMNIHIYDDEFSIEEIRATARELKNKSQLDILFIDYLQLMDTKKKYNNSNERVSILSRNVKLLAKEMDIPVILLSQLSRKSEHEKRRPNLSDLRESGSIEQDADNVWFLHDPTGGQYDESKDNKQELEIIIGKQRAGIRDVYGILDYYKSVQRIYDRRIV